MQPSCRRRFFTRQVRRGNRLILVVRPQDMSNLLRWPGDFADVKAVTAFQIAVTAFFDQITAAGATVQVAHDETLLAFERRLRRVDFVLRGHSRKLNGQQFNNREPLWEVCPSDNGRMHRLGPLFGIGDTACVVITGISDIAAVTKRWLDGDTIADTVKGVSCWDRSEMSSPLNAVP